MSARRTLLAGSVAALVAAAPALAHVEPSKTTPKSGAKASSAQTASVTFTGPIRSGTLAVYKGKLRVSVDNGGRDPRNVKRLLTELKSGIKAGSYKAKWKIVASDGHKESGSFTFKLR